MFEAPFSIELALLYRLIALLSELADISVHSTLSLAQHINLSLSFAIADLLDNENAAIRVASNWNDR